MQKRVLGSSGLAVSVMGLGCWALGGGPDWGAQDEREAVATIHAALDHGVTLFDTAEAYAEGHSEEVVGRALVGRRDRALIATKLSPSNAAPATLRAHCEASLRRLQTDYMDLYQVHWPIDDPQVDEACATLRDLQREGKVRHVGVSNHGVQQLGRALATGTSLVSNQLCYNLLCRAIEYEILPLCRARQMGVITYMPLMQGILAGRYATLEDVPVFRRRTRHFSSARSGTRHGEPGAEAETFAAIARIRQIAADHKLPMGHVALAWVAAKRGVTCVLAGSRSPQQVAENVAGITSALASAVIAELDAATEPLRQKLGPNADYWQGSARSRTR